MTLPVPVTARSRAWVADASLLGLKVRIPPEAWVSFCCEYCVFFRIKICASGSSLLERSRTERACLMVCDPEALIIRRPCPTGEFCAIRN
jgi:hypothetical protein